mmetsp:Transcript_21708/g.52463  ORF Transcript_21708/g.52463 Transcript_21708/m.52463 type:complete len:641 (-) Transcript_21708:22-1944(-)
MASTAATVATIAATFALAAATLSLKRRSRERNDGVHCGSSDGSVHAAAAAKTTTTEGGYESLIGNTPLVYLPKISSLLPNKDVNIFVKMESLNPGGTGKDRAARSMILDAERRGELPPPLSRKCRGMDCIYNGDHVGGIRKRDADASTGEAYESSNVQPNTNEKNNTHQFVTSQSNALSSNSKCTNTNINDFINIPENIHSAILTALHTTQTHGILIEGTSGSTGISLASLSASRGHATIVIMPDDQSSQKAEFLRRLGCGVVVVKNCGISNPDHYVNVARRVWEWLEVERRYDSYYWEEIMNSDEKRTINGHNGDFDGPSGIHQSAPKKLITAAFMNQFENLANVNSHYTTTGPEIYSQLDGKVDAFVMSAGTGGTLVGVGGYLKEQWYRENYPDHENLSHDKTQSQQIQKSESKREPPTIALVDPPGSSLYNKIKYGVAYASQQSERRLRRHRYDTLAEGIGLDRITANFGLGCEDGIVDWYNSSECKGGAFGRKIDALMNIKSTSATNQSNNTSARRKVISNNRSTSLSSSIVDDAISVTDQQAVYMAHYLLRHEGLFVGSSTAMNLVGALAIASQMTTKEGEEVKNVVTVVCDGGQRHTSRFWNRDFIVDDWGLVWPGDDSDIDDKQLLELLGISI